MIPVKVNLRICSCLACVYRVMDARGKFGEHERCVRVARGDSIVGSGPKRSMPIEKIRQVFADFFHILKRRKTGLQLKL